MKKRISALYQQLHVYFHRDVRLKWYQRRIVRWSAVFVVLLSIFAYLTNPFVRFSIVTDPLATVEFDDGQFGIDFQDDLIVRSDPVYKALAKLKATYHIVGSRFGGGHKARAESVDEIIREIHALRFNPEHPYLISGDHFSVLYPRSLGIFYHSILDPRTALDETDWKNRQLIYLKTLAYTLSVYGDSSSLSTTIVPVGIRSVALLNIYAPPSDTLYSMLYALSVMRGDVDFTTYYPFQHSTSYPLETKGAADTLLEKYLRILQYHYGAYRELVYDENTGLVRRDVLLSGTKDIAKREGAFYDNILFWRTTQLAGELGIIPFDEEFLADYKHRILDKFWYDDGGYFLEDLSEESMTNHYYSSDWLIAYQTGFLDPDSTADRMYVARSLAYIDDVNLDEPFGLSYSTDRRDHRMYRPVRYAMPTYGSTVIWSNWGMEYTKLLTHMAQITGDSRYLDEAGDQIEAYTFNIKRYRGYPEVYRSDGDFYRTGIYKSIRQTGWVVTFEQAKAMYEWTSRNWIQFNSSASATE